MSLSAGYCRVGVTEFIIILITLVPLSNIAWYILDAVRHEGFRVSLRNSFNKLFFTAICALGLFATGDFFSFACLRNVGRIDYGFMFNVLAVILSTTHFCCYVRVLQRRSNGLLSEKYRNAINKYTNVVIICIIVGEVMTVHPLWHLVSLLGGILIGCSILSLELTYLIQMNRYMVRAYKAGEKPTKLAMVAKHGFHSSLFGLVALGFYGCMGLMHPRSSAYLLLRGGFKLAVSISLLIFMRLRIKMRISRGLTKRGTTKSDHAGTQVNTLVEEEQGALYIPAFLRYDATDFRFQKKLGEGGFGQVFLADAFESGLKLYGTPLIAKKLAESPLHTSKDKLAAFYQEMSVMYLLKDEQNIAKVAGFSEDPLCILMKYYPLGSLDSFMFSKQYPMSKRLLVGILKDIACGIESMHKVDIAHCDIKPQNVLIGIENGRIQAVLTDFGISKVLSDKLLLVESFEIINVNGVSIQYASPEALMRFRRKFMYGPAGYKASDVYAHAMVTFNQFVKCSPWKNQLADITAESVYQKATLVNSEKSTKVEMTSNESTEFGDLPTMMEKSARVQSSRQIIGSSTVVELQTIAKNDSTMFGDVPTIAADFASSESSVNLANATSSDHLLRSQSNLEKRKDQTNWGATSTIAEDSSTSRYIPAFKEVNAVDFIIKKHAKTVARAVPISPVLKQNGTTEVLVHFSASNQAFETEAKLLWQLRECQFVIGFLGFCRVPMCIITCSYGEGTIASVKKLSRKDKVGVLSDVSSGLVILHSLFIAHCNLTAENIWIEKKDRLRARIGGFGKAQTFMTAVSEEALLSDTRMLAKVFEAVLMK